VARVSSLRPVSGTAEEILALLREWDAAEAPEPLVIATSGSTGTPKRVVLSRDAMRASALATHERLGGPGQWVLNLPPTYVAGVQVLYRSVIAGTEPVITTDLVGSRQQVRGRSYLSLVPTQLMRDLRDLNDGSGDRVAAIAEFDAVLVGGGPLNPAVRSEAERHGIRIAQTYGMSETCGGCVYDGLPLDGVEMRIGDGGEVLLRGPMLFEGYDGEPARTAHALRGGWFHTDDLGEIAGDGRLRVIGRADDMIISGGVKVPAGAVASSISADEAVRAVEVLGVPDPEWGERVVAFVAANDPITLTVVRDLVEPRAWAPRQLVLVEELPLLPNGKPDRAALRRMALDG
jgi:O-succinylbenzoic acid--CoA ligase